MTTGSPPVAPRGGLRGVIRDFILPLAVAFAIAFVVQAALAKPYEIPTGSMLPTIQEHDRVLANRLIYRFREPRRGDIIVFEPTQGARVACGDPVSIVPFVKRIIGVGGDLIQVRDYVPYVNGVPFVVDRAVLSPSTEQGRPFFPRTGDATIAGEAVRVPAHHYFVMGDNRPASCDSRFWPYPTEDTPTPTDIALAFVDRDAIVGQAEFTYWPINHLAFLD